MIQSVEMIIRQPGHSDRVVRVHEGTTRIGRAEDNDVVLSDVGVSRRHARILLSSDAVAVEDLGSGNGTYIRGLRVQVQDLHDGDEVIIDPFILTFRIQGDVRRRPAEAPLSVQNAPARLDVIVGTGMAQTSYPIGPRGLTVGRSENRDVVIPDPAASRHHCTIIPRDGEYVLRDMGSANGTFANSVRVRESLLADGDRVRIGNTELRFVVNDATRVGQTTTQDQGGGWQRDDWTDSDVSLPIPEPRAARTARPRRGASRLVAAALLALFAAGGVSLVTLAAGLGALLWFGDFGPGSRRPVSPPSWSLQLPGGLPQATVADLFDQGIAAMRERDNRVALQSFYRALVADPGNPAAERLAFVAGEFVILDQMEAELTKRAKDRKEREATRDALLADVASGGTARRRALSTLEKDFREDPTVIEALGWKPGPAAIELKGRLEKAAQLEAEEKWGEAAAIYEEVLATGGDPALRKRALARWKVVRRELARAVAVPWREGVLAEIEADRPAALAHYDRVLQIDGSNGSARLRRERLQQ